MTKIEHYGNLIEASKKATKELLKKATEKYVDGKSTVAWEFVTTDDRPGMYIVRTLPGDSFIELAYVSEDFKWADIGCCLGSFPVDIFSIDQLVELMAKVILVHEGEE